MKRQYFLKRAINTARLSRLLAKAIDLFIVLILSVFFYPLGLMLSVVYLVVADSLQNGQSVGKRLIGLQVISLEDGSYCSLRQSFIRNLPFIIPVAFAIIPIGGVILGIITGIPFMLLELFFIYKLDSGHRLGDVIADTSVMGHDGTQLKVSPLSKKSDSWFAEKSAPLLRYVHTNKERCSE
jgi:uncharacterized RDD family membrane protein YckC